MHFGLHNGPAAGILLPMETLAALSFEWMSNPEIWISLATLTLLEIVLGIDNIVFISILAGKLPESEQAKARQMGLSLALITRILLLCGIAWVAQLTEPWFEIPAFLLLKEPHPVSGRDLILIAGGLFLLAKSTHEIHEKLEGQDGGKTMRMAPTFTSVIIQILMLDLVFSLDSVITAVGMVRQVPVMIAAVVLAMIFMMIYAKTIGEFIHRHPTLKMLALSFLILIGCMLVAEGFDKHIPKGYIYFAMAFSVGVETLNIRMRSKQSAADNVELRQPYR